MKIEEGKNTERATFPSGLSTQKRIIEMISSAKERSVPYASGDHIKFEISDDKTGESEWMWLKVERIDESRRVAFGVLDSQPVVFAHQLRLGQQLAVSFDNIRDHRPKD